MTKHLVASRIARCLLGLAILVIASPAAMAQTATLICRWDTSPSQSYRDEPEPSTIELNEAQSSVVVHFSAYTIFGTLSGGQIPAHSAGPLPATFTADTISFSDQGFVWTINRLTGSLTNDAKWRWNCEAGQKKF